MALKADGTVTMWGVDSNQPPGLTSVSKISAGLGDWYLALTSASQPKVVIVSVTPSTRTAGVGSRADFIVSATGVAPLSYQWYFGPDPIPGATNQSLTLDDVQLAQSGNYSVVVTNAQGSATSQPVTLNVIPSIGIETVPALTLNGALGSTYRIDYINAAGPTNAWAQLATVTLTNLHQFYFDLSAIGQPARFYRIVPVP